MAGARKKTSGFGIFPGSKGIALVSKTKGSEEETSQYLQCVFGHRENTFSASGKLSNLFANLSSLETDLDKELEDVKERNKDKIAAVAYNKENGRLGPEKTLFDNAGNYGTVIIDSDRLGAASPVNFSTVRANTCVYKGKWCFEVMLGSMGVMQVGWCSLSCKFTQEDGVGDTEDSYSYDGNRVRKWNSKTPCKYGQMWLTGDVITCCIDCDIGTVSFYRNGHPLGEAYNTVRLGPGKSYFPAVSLSKTEQVKANFGSTPLKYPVDGYLPLQAPPMLELVQAQKLFDYVENIVLNMAQPDKFASGLGGGGVVFASASSVGSSSVDPLSAMACSVTAPSVSPQVVLMLIASHVFDRLAPLLTDSYIIEVCLVSVLWRLYDAKAWQEEGANPVLMKILDLLHSFLQDFELKTCLEHIGSSLVSSYRYARVDEEFTEQFRYLTLTLAILRHEASRKFLLKHVIFDKVKFPLLMHVKPPDDEGLADIIPQASWDVEGREETADEKLKKTAYYASCSDLRNRIQLLEKIQVEMVKLLLTNTDNSKGVSTRFIFLHKFREFLKENSQTPARSHLGNVSPLPACLSFFHRLIQAVRHYWDLHAETNPGSGVTSEDAFVPACNFYDDSINYFDHTRLGGLISHLKKTYKDQVYQAVLTAAGLTSHRLAQHRALLVKHNAFVEAQKRLHSDDAPLTSDHASVHSLVEILDGLVILYTIAAHTQLGKMCTLRDNIRDYSKAYEDVKNKMAQCPKDQPEVYDELERSVEVFLNKSTEQSRQMAWVIANIYTEEKQADVFWLLKVCLSTVERGSAVGTLFTFMPSFYVDAIMDTYNALKGYFHPTVPSTGLEGMEAAMHRIGLFFSNHISDSRIVNADTKDTIIHALACFVCFPNSLKVLESIPLQNQDRILRFLLASYEERSWAQTNWILVRLWKGCGFAFRYQHLPNSLPMKNQQQMEINSANQAPNPSLVLQRRIAELLKSDAEMATKLLDTVLSQLNWAWSEFIEMLQGLQQLVARPIQVFIDSRQLKICATCFEIAVGLLRTIELLVSLAPELVTDYSKTSAELLLCRLCQSLSQVLNRVTTHSNTFDTLVSAGIPGKDTVDHFPVLTALAGILVQLLHKTEGACQENAVTALLMEPSFEISSLDFMLGGLTVEKEETEGAAASETKEKKPFSFKNFDEVSMEELALIESLRDVLRSREGEDREQQPPMDEDTVCDICYARPKAVKFSPCNHQSCKACIAHHLMSKKECFFCKVTVQSVLELSTGLPLALPSLKS